jgi:hypothetical protein
VQDSSFDRLKTELLSSRQRARGKLFVSDPHLVQLSAICALERTEVITKLKGCNASEHRCGTASDAGRSLYKSRGRRGKPKSTHEGAPIRRGHDRSLSHLCQERFLQVMQVKWTRPTHFATYLNAQSSVTVSKRNRRSRARKNSLGLHSKRN